MQIIAVGDSDSSQDFDDSSLRSWSAVIGFSLSSGLHVTLQDDCTEHIDGFAAMCMCSDWRISSAVAMEVHTSRQNNSYAINILAAYVLLGYLYISTLHIRLLVKKFNIWDFMASVMK